MDELIITIFCEIDNFCKKFISYMKKHCLPSDEKPVSFEIPSALTLSEVMTICKVSIWL